MDQIDARLQVHVKGAPEEVLPRCADLDVASLSKLRDMLTIGTAVGLLGGEVTQVYDNVDVSGEIAKQLPPKYDALAGPISAALRSPAEQGVDQLLARPRVVALWENANRIAHQELVAVLEDKTRPGVSTANGSAAAADSKVADLRMLPNDAMGPLFEATVGATDESVLVFSSGTTGLPKAVRHTHTSMAIATGHWVDALGLGHDDRFQVATPPSHILGLLNLLAAARAGATVRVGGFQVRTVSRRCRAGRARRGRARRALRGRRNRCRRGRWSS